MSQCQKPGRVPKASIGMPVYNAERHIREALDSLLAQTFTDFELIISDNASTDATGAICQEYAARDSRIRYVRQSENRGAMSNFQFVLDEAAGEYFMWAAGDDRWDAAWLGTLAACLDPGVSVAFGSGVSFDDRTELPFTLKAIQGPRTWRMLRYFLWSEWGPKPNAIYGVYRTQDLIKVSTEVVGNAADNRWGFDNILVFKMLQFGCLAIEPGVTFYKRIHRIAGFRPTFQTRRLTWRRIGPYLREYVRRSPPGQTQCAVAIATPMKYGWFFCRGIRRLAAPLLGER